MIDTGGDPEPKRDGTVPADRGRAMALDLGSRRIGVALGDRAGTLAFPRPNIERSGNLEEDHRCVVQLVSEEDVSVLVVGWPLSLDGNRGPAARTVENEMTLLAIAVEGMGVRLERMDERFTTVTASRALRGSGKSTRKQRTSVDSAAATVLLQSWLDRQRP